VRVSTAPGGGRAAERLTVAGTRKTWLDGPDDPEMILIAVRPESAEYWDLGNKLVALVKCAVGTIPGPAPRVTAGSPARRG